VIHNRDRIVRMVRQMSVETEGDRRKETEDGTLERDTEERKYERGILKRDRENRQRSERREIVERKRR
jgi:hypothetical protein